MRMSFPPEEKMLVFKRYFIQSWILKPYHLPVLLELDLSALIAAWSSVKSEDAFQWPIPGLVPSKTCGVWLGLLNVYSEADMAWCGWEEDQGGLGVVMSPTSGACRLPVYSLPWGCCRQLWFVEDLWHPSLLLKAFSAACLAHLCSASMCLSFPEATFHALVSSIYHSGKSLSAAAEEQ